MSNRNLFGVDVRDRQPPEIEHGIRRSARGMTPFSNDRMEGRRYGPMTPYNTKGAMMPLHFDPMEGKPSGTPMLGRYPKKRQGASDLLHTLDGQPDIVKEWIWDLIMDRVPELRTGQQLTDVLRLVPRGQRLNINYFDGSLNIPTNTIKFEANFKLNTAYEAGDIVIDGDNVFIYVEDVPATNTVRPAADSRAEHLDAGSPLDLVNIVKRGLIFTVTRRGGDIIRMEITPSDILGAIQAMTDQQKTQIRTEIDASPRVHDHDDRYYTESQSDNKYSLKHGHPYAPSSTISATVANILAGIKGFTDSQDTEAKTALGITIDPLKKTDWTPVISSARGVSGTPRVITSEYVEIYKMVLVYLRLSYNKNANRMFIDISLPFPPDEKVERGFLVWNSSTIPRYLSTENIIRFVSLSSMCYFQNYKLNLPSIRFYGKGPEK